VDVAHFVQTFDRSQRFYCTVEAGIFAEKEKKSYSESINQILKSPEHPVWLTPFDVGQ
jgi:hypothetical protein